MKTYSVLSVAILVGMGIGISTAASPPRTASKQATVQRADPGYTAVTQRGQLAGQIVRKWANYVRQVYGTSPMAWAENMSASFAAADLYNMQRAANRSTFEGMMSSLKGQTTSDARLIEQLAAADGDRLVIQALGSPSEDLVYTAVTPCRLFDTRIQGGPITQNTTRDFFSSATNFLSQGGAATNCNIPADVGAVVVNVVIVHPTDGGYITVFPYLQTRPLASSVNIIPGEDVSNELIIKQTQGAAFDFSIFVDSAAPVHVAGDVAGFFAAPIATALECVEVPGTATTIPTLGTVTALADNCATGFTSTSLRCEQTGTVGITAILASVTAGGCTFSNPIVGLTSTALAVRTCCRIPGR